MEQIKKGLKDVAFFKWNPTKDLIVVAISWILVVSALYTATVIVGQKPLGGTGYFLIYAIVGATIFGIGIPVFWMAVINKQSITSLGISKRHLLLSFALQCVFSILLYGVTIGKTRLPEYQSLLPLVALSMAIGFFEAIFWRGWVL